VTPDNGLQPERTVMAWQRTALGLGGVSALLLHHADGRLGGSLAGAAGLLATLVMLILVELRQERRREGDENSPMGAAAIRSLTLVTVLLSVASAVVVLTQRG
jgi:putative membrane protein